MINYTERLTLLMQDIVSRVPALVVHRHGRRAGVRAAGTVECRGRLRHLPLPQSSAERARLLLLARPRIPACITRRSEWFVTKSPVVTIGARQMKYMISFTLPRFCDQSLDRSRKERCYPGAEQPWIAKLDTVVHELYHIDPEQNGIRRIDRGDGTYSAHCHSHQFFEQVADDGRRRISTRRPDPAVVRFSPARLRRARGAPRRRRRHELPDVSVLSPAVHRGARRFSLPCEADTPRRRGASRSAKGSSRCTTPKTTSTSGSS